MCIYEEKLQLAMASVLFLNVANDQKFNVH